MVRTVAIQQHKQQGAVHVRQINARQRKIIIKIWRKCSDIRYRLVSVQNLHQYPWRLSIEQIHKMIVGKCAGMFAESIQGVGGTMQFTKGYIKQAAELVRKNGGVFVSDEVIE